MRKRSGAILMKSIFSVLFLGSIILSLGADSPGSIPKPESGKSDSSVVPRQGKRISENVENGLVYDKATVKLEGTRTLHVPENAEVQFGDVPHVQIYMAKSLSFAGHPPAPIQLVHVRANMGMAMKIEGTTRHLATFGEWDTRREGTATLRVRIVVPKGITVERRGTHSGPESVAHSGTPGKQRAPSGGYWYGPRVPSEGWTAIAHEPDLARTLEKKAER